VQGLRFKRIWTGRTNQKHEPCRGSKCPRQINALLAKLAGFAGETTLAFGKAFLGRRTRSANRITLSATICRLRRYACVSLVREQIHVSGSAIEPFSKPGSRHGRRSIRQVRSIQVQRYESDGRTNSCHVPNVDRRQLRLVRLLHRLAAPDQG